MDNATYEQMREVGRRNLEHALEDTCTDPDCEIHNPDVGYGEETVDLTDLAFFVAGYLAGAAAMGDRYDSVKGNLRDEMQQLINPQEGQ
jgi:hypothetical protein